MDFVTEALSVMNGVLGHDSARVRLYHSIEAWAHELYQMDIYHSLLPLSTRLLCITVSTFWCKIVMYHSLLHLSTK